MTTEKIFKGKIKFYNEEKGFGFITDKETNNDIFFGAKQAAILGVTHKHKGESVTYSLIFDKKKNKNKVNNLKWD